jgi:ABC-type uncharacterized transport system permease subunit
MHCWIYIADPVGNFVKPPLIVAPAGFKFVNGLLEKAKVSACDGAAARTGIAVAIASAIAANLLRDNDIISPISLFLTAYFLKVIGMKRSCERSPSCK